MKTLFTLIFFCSIGANTLSAQTIVITGMVTSSVAEEGAITGATVQVKGTANGTLTDVNGKYELRIPPDATTLIFSYIGMKKQEVEITGRSVIDVVMEYDILSLQEVVITTGYGIKRAPRSTSSLTQVVSGDKLNEARETNINNALAGKISGIQFRGQSAIALNRTGSMRLRGEGGFGIGGGILYVIDGTILPNSNDLNMDDIENISVLSGPGASAILGSQGANGAIIITTKKAKISNNKSLGIEINTGVMTSVISRLPAYQNDYAGGANTKMTEYIWTENDPVEWKPLDGKYYPDYQDDSSWGPRMEGQEYIPWYSWYPGTKYTGTTANLVPQPNNVRDFYDRGWTFNNNIAFSKAGDNYSIRSVLGNVALKGNLPGSASDKTTFAIKASYDLSKRLTFATNLNFITTSINGEFNDGLNNHSTGSFNEFFHRDLDINILKELRGLRSPEGIYATWNHKDPSYYDPLNPKDFYGAFWWFNYYTFFDLIKLPSRSDHLFGDISLNFKIIEGLAIKITYRRQQNNGWREEQYSTDLNDSQTDAVSPWGNWKAIGYYCSSTSYSNRENIESLLTFTKKIGDFNINGNAGSDFFSAILKSNSANTVNGLIVRNLFTITNSLDQPNITNGRINEKYRALFLRGDIGYKNLLYGEFTLRNDWFSSLPPSNNSILSKSFGASFIFSDLLKFQWLSFGKFRASWGEIPTSIAPYVYPGSLYTVGQYQWNGNFLMNTPDQLVDKRIHGEVKTQKEVGLELRFLDNKFGLITTYWDGSEKDIPYPVSISKYSGFTSMYLNTGKIIKQGLDLSINVSALEKTNFSYELNAIFSCLIKNEVEYIADGIPRFTVESVGEWWPGAPAMVHAEGRKWGELFGTGMKMWDGKPMLNSDGTYVPDQQKYFGSVLPKVTGGIQNSFKILKNIIVIANFDYQVGGKFFSISEMLGAMSGVTARTSGINDKGNPIRDPVADGGGIHVTGVDATTHSDVDYYIEAHEYFFDNLVKAGIYDPYIYDLTYIKLRELSIGYDFPVEKIRGITKYIKSAKISFIAQNPWLLYSVNKDFDPTELSQTGGEWAQFPGTRSYGINLKINF